MIDMAAGLSTMGYIPFASTFAVFSGRCFEQIRNGVAYPHFNVKFGMTHAGITLGEDGGSHQAIEDVALMRAVPGMTIIVPCDAKETYSAVKAAAQIDGPVYLRLARLASTGVRSAACPSRSARPTSCGDGKDVVSLRLWPDGGTSACMAAEQLAGTRA